MAACARCEPYGAKLEHIPIILNRSRVMTGTSAGMLRQLGVGSIADSAATLASRRRTQIAADLPQQPKLAGSGRQKTMSLRSWYKVNAS
jgi:hypothetical protein